MQTSIDQKTPEKIPEKPKNKPFFECETVQNTRFGYKAGENYRVLRNCTVNLYIPKRYIEADLMLFYEFRATGLKFHRVTVARLVIYTVFNIENNYLNQLCYEFNK